MPDDPIISIILPVHNRQDLVRRSIDSVLTQTMTDFELLVIDDCSTDATAEVVAAYCDDSRVRLHSCTKNLGPAGARNKGIELARGRYVAFQDSDDRWFPEKLERQIAALEKHPDRRICYCGALYYAEDQCYYIPRKGTLDAESAKNGDLSAAVLYSNPTTPQTLVIERALFNEVGGFDETLRINEDWDLSIRMAQRVRFVFVPEPLVVIYRTAGSISSDRAADTAARQKFLTEYELLYAKHPTSRARQNYIIGGQSLESHAYGDAVQYFRQSFRDAPSLRCLLQIQRARLRALIRAYTS